ncbi:SDR family NAD(P)-dependent oxidoreductase [Paracoccus suum]|uniref:SDR family NAD(P)-dependent oxidoreductase n=1 Tax=Paracoccus suum TaxID=2259340 RepID=A0A344PGI4_9RHOB|nr:NAD(P)H-binding protein [Paracoccus suum]AXC48489.1 SDR family NAD(P)-dependent oxidoreductase [Paracoccus suum]
MIVVTGATGRLGGGIVAALLARMPAEQIGVSARDPLAATDLAERGVRVRFGDFAEPDSLGPAFEGARQLLLVSSNAEAQGGDAVAQHRDAIAAAMAAGVERIVYTSHMGASATSAFAPMRGHAATEALLARSGLRWTALRNGFYASTVQAILQTVPGDLIETPQDGKVCWTAHADLADAAAAVLLDEGRFDGPTPPLTAAEALDFADIARVLTGLRGSPVVWKAIPDDALQARLRGLGVSDRVIDVMLGLYRAARAGDFAATDSTLGALIGRQPRTLAEVLARPV